MDLAEVRVRHRRYTVRHPWEVARRDVIRALLARHVALTDGSAVLDIGCGDIFVVERLAAEHPDVLFHAIDTAFSSELVSQLRTRLTVSNVGLSSSLESIDPPLERRVALLLLMDVIEHVEDDRRFLTDLVGRPYIDVDTRILITVPAYQSLVCSHDTFFRHYRRYSVPMLREHVEAAGLEAVDLGYFFFSLVPIRTLQIIRERVLRITYSGATTGLLAWTGHVAKAAALKQLLVWDATAGLLLKRVGIRLPSLSSYAICRKSA